MSRYMWVDARKAEGFEVKAACQAAEVATSSYYDFKVREASGPSEQEWDEAILIWTISGGAGVDTEGSHSR